MHFISWIVLGGVAGWLASIITGANKSMGLFLNIFAGVIGASIGGFIFKQFGGQEVTGLNWHSLIVATVGAVILIVIIKLIRK